MIDPEISKRMAAAISESNFRWRTAEGISKDTGIPYEEVLEVLNEDAQFVQSKRPNQKGRSLYTTRQKRNTSRTFSMRFMSALTNKLAE